MSGNVEFMKRFVEFINSASEKLAHELVSPDAIFHAPVRPEPVVGPAGYLMIIGMMRGGFPDVQWTLEELISEGDKVAARFTMRGTHQGQFMGVPPYRQTSHHTGAEYLPSDKRSDHQRVRPT
jgi:predicted ester cyclase